MKRRILALTIALLMMAQPVIYSAEEVPELCGVVLEGGIADAPVDVGGVTLEGGGLLLEDGGSGILPDDESGLILDGLSDAAALTNGDDGLAGNDAAPMPDAPGAEAAFVQTVALDGLEFTVTAGTGAFPADAALRVEAVDESAALPVSQSAECLMGEAASHHVLSIAVLDGAGNPLQPNPALELPVVHVDGMTGSMRVFAYDQDAQSSLEIETENYEFRLEKSGLYDIAEVARNEMPSGDEQAQPDAPTTADGQPADGQPAEDGAGDLLPAEDLQLDGAGSEALMQLEALGTDDQGPGLDGLGQDGYDLSIEGIEMAGENGEDSQPDQLEVNLVAFEQSKTVNGVVVTAKADPGVFPGNAVLSVKRVPTARRKDANAAIEEVRDDAQNVAVSYSFDIKVIDPDTNETLQPAGGQTVSVSFALSEVADENLETNVYHVTQDEATGELTAQSLDVSQTVTQTTGEETTAVVETDGFSIYTVEFTYNDMEYVMPGDTSVQMSAILETLGLTGDVTAVKVSDERLFSASEENGAWIVTAHQAFTSTEWMKVTINEVVYKITVTDSLVQSVSYIDERGAQQTCDAIVLTASDIQWTDNTETSGWYLVNDVVNVEDRITVKGDVKLILANVTTLRAKKGITVSTGNSLKVYAQSKVTGAGALVAESNEGAAIGEINDSGCGSITVYGGVIEATSTDGAGIGGSSDTTGTVSINGRVNIVAKGGNGCKGIGGDKVSLDIGDDVYVYEKFVDKDHPTQNKAIDKIDGVYARTDTMYINNVAPDKVAELTSKEYYNESPFYNKDNAFRQWMAKGGTLKLCQDIKLDDSVEKIVLKDHDDYVLDLNGLGLIYNKTDLNPVITVGSGATLALKDSNDTKKKSVNAYDPIYGTSVSKSVTGGYITGGTACAVNVGTGGRFVMSCGTIIGNKGGYGGGVRLSTSNAVFTMSGGTIIGNMANIGSGVYMTNGTFNLYGSSQIKENYASNVYLSTPNKINVSDALVEGASVGVTMQESADPVFTTNYGVKNADVPPHTYFTSDATGKKVLKAWNQVPVEAKLGEHQHEYKCTYDKTTVTITCDNKDCGHEGDTQYTLAFKIPNPYVYGAVSKPEDLLDAKALAAFNEAYKDTDTVTAEKIKFFEQGSGTMLNSMPIDVGNYKAQLTIKAMDNSEDITIFQEYKIVPKDITITGISVMKKTYDGTTSADIVGTPALDGIAYDDVLSIDSNNAKASFGDAAAAADKPVTIEGYTLFGLKADNYNLVQPTGIKATIDKRELLVTWDYDPTKPLVYNGTMQAPTVTARVAKTGVPSEEGKGLVGDDTCTLAVEGGHKDAGSYTATASSPRNTNYKLPTDDTLTQNYTIAQKPVTIVWGDATLVYDGTQQTPKATATVLKGDSCEVMVSGAKTNAGDNYTAKATDLSNKNYRLPTNNAAEMEDYNNLTKTFSIAQKTIGLSWGETFFQHDGGSHVPDVTATNLVEGDSCPLTVSGAQTDMGTHTATVNEPSNTNYKLPDDKTIKFVIGKKKVPLAWENLSFTYDGQAHAPTVTVTETISGEECVAKLKIVKIGDESGQACEAIDAGTYRATVTSLTNNYIPEDNAVLAKEFTIAPKLVKLEWPVTSLTYNGTKQKPAATVANKVAGDTCEVTVSGEQKNASDTSYTATAVKLSNDNYKLPDATKDCQTSYKIARRVAELSWSNTTLTYNGQELKPTVTVANKVSGDTCTVTVTGGKTNAGSYTATASGLSNDNYTLPANAKSSFTINKKTVGLSWGNAVYTYDGQNHLPEATATNLVSGDTCTVTVTGAAKDAGKHTATASALSNGNYALPTGTTKDFNIARITAELEWGASAFTYDGQNHAPTATVKNLVKGDTCTVTVTGSKKDAGSYTATASALSNGNYALPSTKTQKYTISRKTVGLAWSDTALTYTGKNQAPTATATGVVEGDTCTVTVSGAQKNVGSHTATATGLSNKNYALPDASDASAKLTQAFTIGPKTAELTWSNTSLTYNGKEQAPTVKVTGLFSGDTCTATVTGGATNVGSYTATAEGLSNANYALPATVTQAFTIARKAVGLKWSNTSFTYDGASHVPTATITGLASGDACVVTVDGAAVNAGSYTATATGLSNGNYGLPENITQAFTIAQKAAKVTASNQTVNEGDEINASAATLTDAIEGHTLKSVKLTADGTKITPSEAVIVDATGGDMTANYKISYVTGKLTVVKPTTAPTTKPTTAPTIQPTTAPTTKPTTAPTVKPTTAPTTQPTTAPTEAPIVGPIKVRIDVKDCKVTVKNQTYTGKKLTPKVKVRLDKVELVQGKDYTVTYKNNIKVGVATVIVKGKGLYTASRKVTFKILPKRTGFTRLTGGNRAITLEWKQPKNITGYQIQYALNGKMTGARPVNIGNAGTRTTTVTGLAPQTTYYVRIRTYKRVGKKIYYSKWSGIKKVTTA